MTTQNGVSYTYSVPGNNTELGENNWYGFSLWEIPVADLKFDAKLDEDITVVADAQYTKYPFKVSVSLVKRSDGSLERLTYPDDVVIPTTANSKGLYIATVKLNDLLSGKDLTQYTSLAILLVRQRQSNDDYGNITIRQVYLHQNTSTNEITYDPVNGSHYVDLNSDAWSAWGCVSINYDENNKKMFVTVAPKKDANGNYYTDDKGSPRVLGGLVLDIGQRDFTKVLRVQMNQEGGRVKGVYITGEGDQYNLTGKLLNYLDVVKQDGTDINGNQKFWYSQYDFRYIPYQHESESVRSMEWTTEWPYGTDKSTTHLPTNFTDQTMSISQFLITYDVFRAEPWHEASLRNAPLYSINNDKVSIDDGHFNYTTGLKVTGNDASIEDWRVIYGSNLGLYNSRYAYVKGIDQIKIYATDGLTFAAVFDLEPDSWKHSQTVWSKNAGKVSDSYKNTYQGKNDHNQYYVYTIDVPHDVSRLHILKLTDGTGTVDNVTLYSATSPIDYYVSGQMWGSDATSSSAVTAALSNRLAMNIDATDLRNGSDNKIALNSANKNCLVYVKDKAQVSNTDNVVVRSGDYPDYTYNADNIVLTDAVNSYMNDKSKDISSYHYPFFAPYDIKATNVAYTGYTGKYGTVCLPFSYDPNNNVSVATGSTAPSFYTTQGTMNYDPKVGHYVVNATLVKSGNLAANQPALIVNPDNTPVSYTVSANDVTVTHTAASDLNITDPADNSKTDDTKEESELYQGNLQGVYSMRHPQEGGYVLQQQGDETVMFHKVVDYKPTLTQFRSYLVLPSTSKAKAQNVIGINFLDGETDATAIESATVHNDASKIVARYNAVGERISAPVHGLNVVVMADGSVKKIIVK